MEGELWVQTSHHETLDTNEAPGPVCYVLPGTSPWATDPSGYQGSFEHVP